jgi:hypothetical protein
MHWRRLDPLIARAQLHVFGSFSTRTIYANGNQKIRNFSDLMVRYAGAPKTVEEIAALRAAKQARQAAAAA